jgi:hypothetical protein
MQARALRGLVDLLLRTVERKADKIRHVSRLGTKDRAIGGIMPGLQHRADIGAPREAPLERLLPSSSQDFCRRREDQDRLAEQPRMVSSGSVFVGLAHGLGNRARNACCKKGSDIQLLPHRQIFVNEDRYLRVEH